MFSLIAAVDRSLGIGKGGRLPWRITQDLQFFKRHTQGHVVVMGRKTWDSLPKQPLADRLNVVLTRTPPAPGLQTNSYFVSSVQECTEFLLTNHSNREWFVIGGSDVYKSFLEKKLVSRMYLTHIDHDFECDVQFPVVDWSAWKTTPKELHFDRYPFFHICYYK